MRRKTPVLTEQELEIMKIVWQGGRVTVRDVFEELSSTRKVAYTTVMTMMGVLEEKGRLKRTPGERAYVYEPAQTKQEVVTSMVNDFVARVFDGSARDLLAHLIENELVKAEDLKEISRVVEEKPRAPLPVLGVESGEVLVGLESVEDDRTD